MITIKNRKTAEEIERPATSQAFEGNQFVEIKLEDVIDVVKQIGGNHKALAKLLDNTSLQPVS